MLIKYYRLGQSMLNSRQWQGRDYINEKYTLFIKVGLYLILQRI